MAKVPSVRFNSVEHAINNKFFDMSSIRLKDGASLKIMGKDGRMDVFVVKKGDVLGMRGYQGSPDFIENALIDLLNKMQKHMQKGKDIFEEYFRSRVRVDNVK